MLLIQRGATYPYLYCNCDLKSGETLRAQCHVPQDSMDTNITLGYTTLPTPPGFMNNYATSIPVDYTMHLENLTCTTRTSNGEILSISKIVKVKFDPIITNATCDPQTPKSLSDDYFEYRVTIIGFANPIPVRDSIQFKFNKDNEYVIPICTDCLTHKETDSTCFMMQYLVRDIKKKDFEDGAEAFITIGGTNKTVSCPALRNCACDNFRYDILSVIRLKTVSMLSLWTLIVTSLISG